MKYTFFDITSNEIWLFAVLMTVDMNITLSRDVTPCSLVYRYQRCGVTCCLQLQTVLKNEAESPFEMIIIRLQSITSQNKFFSTF
jgi:hypothetical protein